MLPKKKQKQTKEEEKTKALETCKKIIKTPQVCQEFSLGCLPTASADWHLPMTSPFLPRTIQCSINSSCLLCCRYTLDVMLKWEGKCLDHSLLPPGLHLG